MQIKKLQKQDYEKYIHHSQPTIEEDDIKSVLELLNKKTIAQGELKEIFENQLTNYIGGLHSGLTNSGRSALFLALKTLDIQENDEVIIPTYVCSSVLKTIELIGAKAKIIDISEDYCINSHMIEKNITNKTKAVIVVHTFGISANINPIITLLKERNIYLIEDCAHSIGGQYNNKKLGSFGDMSFYSFQATKMLTSGEGGAVVLNNKLLLDKFIKLKNQYNKLFAISDINTSLLINQLNKLDYYINKRKILAKKYIDELKSYKKVFLPVDDIEKSVFFRFTIRVKKLNFEKIRLCMDKRNIAVRKGVDSMLHNDFNKKYYEKAEVIFNETLSLPIYPSLDPQNIEYIVENLKECLNNEL